jgi:hypothetical protein
MKVREMIDILEEIKDKELPVIINVPDNHYDFQVEEITNIEGKILIVGDYI